jgi:hypothetical protein
MALSKGQTAAPAMWDFAVCRPPANVSTFRNRGPDRVICVVSATSALWELKPKDRKSLPLVTNGRKASSVIHD